MSEPRFTKDPNATLDYAFNWNAPADPTSNPNGPWLASGETISGQTVTVPAGITKNSDSHADGVVTVWLSGGTAGTSYRVTSHITTTAGRQDERSITIDVADR